MSSDYSLYGFSSRSQVIKNISLAENDGQLDSGKSLFGFTSRSQDPTIRLLLVGKTGSGKSSTGNRILGQELFDSDMSFDSVTDTCTLKQGIRHGIPIEVLDCPGLFDTNKSQEEVATQVVQAVACMHPGPTAILYIVMAGNRYTEEEAGVYERLKALLDPHVTQYMIVLFTRGDELKKKGKKIKDILNKAPNNLRKVLDECDHRVVVFDNTARDKNPQVENLLEMVKKLSKTHDGQPYICPKYSDVGEKMEIEVGKRLQKLEEKELQRKKVVQELEEQTRQAIESAEWARRAYLLKEKTREEQTKKNEEERQKKMIDMMENLKLHLSYSERATENIRQTFERERIEERKEMERQRQIEFAAFKEQQLQMEKLYQIRIEAQMEDIRRREEQHQAQMQTLKHEIAKKKKCVIQ